jgi:hypothetical protein
LGVIQGLGADPAASQSATRKGLHERIDDNPARQDDDETDEYITEDPLTLLVYLGISTGCEHVPACIRKEECREHHGQKYAEIEHILGELHDVADRLASPVLIAGFRHNLLRQALGTNEEWEHKERKHNQCRRYPLVTNRHVKNCNTGQNTAYYGHKRRWRSGQSHLAVNQATSVCAGSNPARRT